MTRRPPAALKRRLRQQARARCGYCLSSEALLGMTMEFEHLTPLAAGGQTLEENLWLSCRCCNQFKGTQTHALDPMTAERVVLFNPRLQDWNEHFRWNEDGTEIVGITSVGRATADALELNRPVIAESVGYSEAQARKDFIYQLYDLTPEEIAIVEADGK